MILTHFIAFDFWPGATDSTIAPPAVVEQGGGGGKRRKPFKSYDQRQRERLEAIQKDQEAKYGVLPKELQEALKPAPSPYKRLDPATVQAYQNAVEREDDEAAMNLIMALL